MNLLRAKAPLACAFSLSLGFHILLLVALDLMARSGLFSGNSAVARLAEGKEKPKVSEFEFRLEPETSPTQFVDANPSQATEEKPEETPYYSVIHAVAGDNSPEDSLDQPEIDGNQDKVLKTTDTPPSAVSVVAMPAEEASSEEVEEANSPLNPDLPDQLVLEEADNTDATVKEGESERGPHEVAMLRPTVPALDRINLGDSTLSEPKPPKPKRLRTLAAVRQQQAALIGEKMKQEGGAKRFRLQAMPDLLATPLGDYHAAVIQAIQQRWLDILASIPTARNARGKVVLKFAMKSDGTIIDLEVVEDSVGVIQSLICQKAVSEPAPYGRWPDDMRRMIGNDRLKVQFSFFYN